MLVVLYHAKVPGVRAGYIGVDVFFVISGFLITRQIAGEISRTGRLAMGRFYARRMRRLLPAALLVVTVTVWVARFWGPPLQSRGIAKDGLFTALYAINFRLASEGVNYQQADGPVSPLQHFWSLAVEEQFYVIWPLLIVIGFWLARRRSFKLVALLLAIATAGSLYTSILVTKTSAPTAYFSVQTRAWEFGFGALIALGATSSGGCRRAAGDRFVGRARGDSVRRVLLLRLDAVPGRRGAAARPRLRLVIASGCGRAPARSADVDSRPRGNAVHRPALVQLVPVALAGSRPGAGRAR